MKRAISIVLSLLMVLTLVPNFSYAAEFTDMPDDWSRPALEKAVENGLLIGDNGKIRPKDNLKRAEMATVVNRAFGAYVKAPISQFSDVSVSSWYYDEMAKAVQMKTFQGNGAKLNPENYITREEAFVVLARALKLEPSNVTPSGFKDLNQISPWARGELYAMINAGYVNGSNGYINPKSFITRAEFAQVMDNIIGMYIKTAGEHSHTFTGNVMINTKDGVLKNSKIKGDLIIGEGVANGTVTLDNVVVEGRLLVRGGGVNSIIIKGNSSVNQVILSRLDGATRVVVESGSKVEIVYLNDGKNEVILEGSFDKVIVDKNVDLQVKNAQIKELNVNAENALVKLDKTAKVELLNISEEAENAKVEVMGTVTKLVTEAPKTAVLGDGTVTEITVKPTADNTVISIPGGKVVVEEGAENVKVPETPPIGGGGGGIFIPPTYPPLTLEDATLELTTPASITTTPSSISINGDNVTVQAHLGSFIKKIKIELSNDVSEVTALAYQKPNDNWLSIMDEDLVKKENNKVYVDLTEAFNDGNGIEFTQDRLERYGNNDNVIVRITVKDIYGQTKSFTATLKPFETQD